MELISLLLYDPQNKCIATRRATKYISFTLIEWRVNLEYPTTEIIDNTLNNTTQLVKIVETETRESIKDYLYIRFIPLQSHKINNTCFTDKLFSIQRLYRGFKY